MTKQTSSALEYIRSLHAAQDTLLEQIDNKLKSLNSEIHINPEEGKILQILITMHQVKTIVEIGTLAGYSAIWMARALPEDGYIISIDDQEDFVTLAKEFIEQSDVKDRITVIKGNASTTLDTLASDPEFTERPLDMIFIDADKISYEYYLDWAEKHVRKGGLIVADNTLLFGNVWLDKPTEKVRPAAHKAMQQFNRRLADNGRYHSVILPTEEGLTVAIKQF